MNKRRNGKADEEPSSGDPREVLASIKVGDAVNLFLEGLFLVKTAIECSEEVGGQSWQWRWLFIDDGSLIEVSPDGYFRYREHKILDQGTSEYEDIVAQDGALVRFEALVREGTSGRRPVHVTFEGKQYRITSTGTATIQRLGDVPKLIPWQALSGEPSENVYFGLVDTADEASVALGLWTSHVCLSFGRPLEASDIAPF
jgi:hypothetical protein